MPWGKDGSFYKDLNEMYRADNKWLQQQKQNELLKEQNRLLNLQEQRMRNGGMTDTERYFQMGLNMAASGARVAPFYLILTLIVGIILLCGGGSISPSIGLYVLSSGFIIESLSVIYDKKKKKKKRGIYEIVMFLIGIVLIVVTFLSISTLKNIVPMLKTNNYTLIKSYSTGYSYIYDDNNIKITELYIDGENVHYKDNIELSKNKNVKLEITYYYVGDRKKVLNKEINFNPKEYFDKFEKEHTIKDFPKANKLYLYDFL